MSEEKVSYPCISERAWWTLRDQFKKSIPSEISDVYIQTLLGMQSTSSARNNVIVPLKAIGFIDADNKPTDLLYDWRLDDKYKEVCDKVLINVYPEELLTLYPDENVDKSKVTNYFMSKNKAGQGQASKLAAFFALLKSGQINSGNLQPKKSEKNKPKSQTKPSNNAAFKKDNDVKATDIQNFTNKQSKNIAIHVDLQIHISPEADAEQIDHIFESMAKYLYKE